MSIKRLLAVTTLFISRRSGRGYHAGPQPRRMGSSVYSAINPLIMSDRFDRGKNRTIAKLAVIAAAATLLIASQGAAQVRVVEANRVAETDRGITPNYGEANGTFPNWQERVFAQLTNRARVAPATDLAGCPPGNCAEAACYSATLPLPWRLELNKAARFHSATMGMFPFFAHDTPCTLFSDIASRYPGTSNGSFASSCSGSGTTLAQTRVNLFAGANQFTGENIAAGSADPFVIFYDVLLYEPTANSACGFHGNLDNGHRYNILVNGPAQGIGYEVVTGSPWESYWTQDFGVGPAIPRIPSGSHWTSVNHTRDPQGGDTTVEFWANWYDVAGAPTTPTVVLDGVPRAMTLARGTTTNGAYTVSVTGVSTACHDYYFSFTSPALQTIRYPDTGTFGFGNGSCADWQNVTAPPAVTGVVATATSSTNVQVTWSGSCATLCRVYRSQFNNKLVYDLAGTGVSPFADAGVTAGHAHLYKVRAFNGVESSDSNVDLANTTMYTNTIIAGSSIVQEDDINQMRDAADAVRTLAGMSAGSYTYGSGSPLRITAGTLIHAADITELRTNLDAAYFALFGTNLSFTNTITPGSSLVRAIDFNEIRTKMQ